MGDPGLLDKLDDFLNVIVLPFTLAARAKSFQWDKAKLDDIKNKFKPYAPASGMGCMQACYDVMGILYSPKTAADIRDEVIKRAYAKADAFIKNNPAAFKKLVEKAMSQNDKLSEADAKKQVRDKLASNENSSDHTFELMREKGLAGDKVHVANADAEQSLRAMTANQPGVYFFGMSVKDYHTVTLAVERGADGSQKIFWMDQVHPGLRTEIKPGDLAGKLNGINFYSNNNTSNIYAFKPPADAGGKP